jgi:hypothetical protein
VIPPSSSLVRSTRTSANVYTRFPPHTPLATRGSYSPPPSITRIVEEPRHRAVSIAAARSMSMSGPRSGRCAALDHGAARYGRESRRLPRPSSCSPGLAPVLSPGTGVPPFMCDRDNSPASAESAASKPHADAPMHPKSPSDALERMGVYTPRIASVAMAGWRRKMVPRGQRHEAGETAPAGCTGRGNADTVGTEDDRLVARALAGDRAACAGIVERRCKPVRRPAFRLLGDADAAAAAARETFVRAYVNLAHYRAGSSMQPWLLAIVGNRCLDQPRRRQTHRAIRSCGWRPSPTGSSRATRHRSRACCGRSCMPTCGTVSSPCRGRTGESSPRAMSTISHMPRSARRFPTRSRPCGCASPARVGISRAGPPATRRAPPSAMVPPDNFWPWIADLAT